MKLSSSSKIHCNWDRKLEEPGLFPYLEVRVVYVTRTEVAPPLKAMILQLVLIPCMSFGEQLEAATLKGAYIRPEIVQCVFPEGHVNI